MVGSQTELDIEADYKVSKIKERVEEKEGIPPVQQRLIYGGKQIRGQEVAGEKGCEEKRGMVTKGVRAA
ncbi:Ubiquitin-like protein 1 [Elasticomyces elasticus]|nr:Ubiquitin-like protein 1 [Elasticomyces elasticus]